MDSYPVELELPVLWGDMDAFGHVNNTVYFRWFESARMAYFERVGIDVARPEKAGPILATTTCEFLAPIEYPATIVTGARVPTVRNTSFVMEYGIKKDGSLVATGSGVIVLVDYETGDKVSVPDMIREAITQLG